MASKNASKTNATFTRKQLIDRLNEDLAREFQAIIAYVNYSQVLKGAAYMNVAAELAVHAGEELAHAIILSNQIDYLGAVSYTHLAPGLWPGPSHGTPPPTHPPTPAGRPFPRDRATRLCATRLRRRAVFQRPAGHQWQAL